MEELKSCPFCGGKAELHHQGNEHTKKRVSIIECKTFGCFGLARVGALKHDFDWMDEKVIEKWNTRAKSSEKEELKAFNYLYAELINSNNFIENGAQTGYFCSDGLLNEFADMFNSIDKG